MKAICEIVKINFDIVATSPIDPGCTTDFGAICEGCDTD